MVDSCLEGSNEAPRQAMSAEPIKAAASLLRDGRVDRLLDALDGKGEETRIVGGAIRNLLLGLPVTEIDFSTTALPGEVTRRAALSGFKVVPTGIEHGTVTIIIDGRPFEVTTLREDIKTDGRRAVVRFGRDFATDAARRDFTINALSLDREGVIHDYAGGRADIAARRVRFIGDPRSRIREDYLRILRFFRFHASYANGAPDADGFAAAIELREGLHQLSAERVRAELLKLLMAPGATATVERMQWGGFWPMLLHGVPHISRFRAFLAGSGETADLKGALPRLAALAVMTTEDATRLRETLRLSNTESKLLWDIAASLEKLHGWAARHGEPAFDFAFAKAVLDFGPAAVSTALGIEAGPGNTAILEALRRRAADMPAFPLSGADVLAHGVRAGPRVGRILSVAEAAWIEDQCPLEAGRLATILEQAIAATKR
jgi:poly(A) polymerase